MDRVDALHAHAREYRTDSKGRADLRAMFACDNETLKRGLPFIHPDLCAGHYFFYNIFCDHFIFYATNVFVFPIRSSMEIFTFTKYSFAPSSRAFSISDAWARLLNITTGIF